MIEREADSGEVVEREMHKLRELDEGDDAPLARLVRFWFALPRMHGMIPDMSDVGLMGLTKLGVMGWFHIVDVHNDDPSHFFYHQFATHASGGHHGIRISDIGSKALRRALERDLVRAKGNWLPTFQGVKTDLSSHSREYRRVALPLASGTHDVTHLLIGVHFDE